MLVDQAEPVRGPACAHPFDVAFLRPQDIDVRRRDIMLHPRPTA